MGVIVDVFADAASAWPAEVKGGGRIAIVFGDDLGVSGFMRVFLGLEPAKRLAASIRKAVEMQEKHYRTYAITKLQERGDL